MVALEKLLCRSAPWRFVAGRFVLPWALQRVTPSGAGLEIGAGSGMMATHLLARFPDLRLTVTDYDASMLAVGRSDLERFGGRAEMHVADATKLPFEDETFDHVFSFIMLHHVLEWEKALSEATRVLRPGGWLVGYGVLDTRLFRLLHKVERATVRLMKRRELEDALDRLAVERAVVTTGTTRAIVRFRMRKTREGSDIKDGSVAGLPRRPAR